MSSSYTESRTTTFTVTHAKHIAAKVATDLKRLQRFYGEPSDTSIAAYEAEVTELLRCGYLGTVTYGYRRNGSWIEPTLRYTARDLLADTEHDDDPGRIQPNADVKGATFYSYLTYSSAWDGLSEAEKTAVKGRLPFERNGAPEPGVNGYLINDRTFSSGGRGLYRASVRSY